VVFPLRIVQNSGKAQLSRFPTWHKRDSQFFRKHVRFHTIHSQRCQWLECERPLEQRATLKSAQPILLSPTLSTDAVF
jgi:hypothetical protein